LPQIAIYVGYKVMNRFQDLGVGPRAVFEVNLNRISRTLRSYFQCTLKAATLLHIRSLLEFLTGRGDILRKKDTRTIENIPRGHAAEAREFRMSA